MSKTTYPQNCSDLIASHGIILYLNLSTSTMQDDQNVGARWSKWRALGDQNTVQDCQNDGTED